MCCNDDVWVKVVWEGVDVGVDGCVILMVVVDVGVGVGVGAGAGDRRDCFREAGIILIFLSVIACACIGRVIMIGIWGWL